MSEKKKIEVTVKENEALNLESKELSSKSTSSTPSLYDHGQSTESIRISVSYLQNKGVG